MNKFDLKNNRTVRYFTEKRVPQIEVQTVKQNEVKIDRESEEGIELVYENTSFIGKK